jgi:hypothetical protein
MKNTAINQKVSIGLVPITYSRLFGEEVAIDQVLAFADHIMRETGTIGNKTMLMRVKVRERKVGLPCGTFAVDSVTYSKPFQWDTPISYDLEGRSALINYIVPHPMYNGYALDINTITDKEPFIAEEDQMPVSAPVGNYVDFEHDGDKLIFNFDNKYVDVVFRIIPLDKDGYPYLTEKAVMAFAYWLNFVNVQRKYFKKQADPNMLQIAEEMAKNHIAKARTPDALSKNEIDSLLNVMTSMNRKFYNTPFGRNV